MQPHTLSASSRVQLRAPRAAAARPSRQPRVQGRVHTAAASRPQDAGGAAHTTPPEAPRGVTRRDLAFGSVGASLALAQVLAAAPAALAEAAVAGGTAQLYTDAREGFSLTLPKGWESSEGLLEGNASFTGASGARRTIAWFSPEVPAADLNVTLTITNTSVEFRSLGSFGNVFTFGSNLVNSMDRSFLLRNMRNPLAQAVQGDDPVQVAKLLDAAEARDQYFVEYTVEKIPGPKRHLYSTVALAWNGRYNRLYTLTGQCLEEALPQYEGALRSVLQSFQPPAPASA